MPPTNATTNIWSTRQLVTMALLVAIGVILSFIEFAIFPAAPYLKYDPSALVALVAGFIFGAGPGVAVGVVGAIIHGLIMGDFWGSIMTCIVVVGYVIPAALIYKHMHTMKGAVIGLIVGAVVAVAAAIVGNLVITPLYSGVSLEAVAGLIIPVLLPFNILKAVLNAVLTLLVYKSISNLVKPKKEQVKGR